MYTVTELTHLSELVQENSFVKMTVIVYLVGTGDVDEIHIKD